MNGVTDNPVSVEGSAKSRAFAVRTVAMMIVPDRVVERMGEIRAKNPTASVMEQLGVSDNTWRKIRAGEPLRASVAMRILDRFGA